MRLTIISAMWNACYLPKVVESVDNQTYKDFQHIFINDNNPGVREVIQQYCNDKNRFWIDFHVRSHFYGALARNTGVMVAFSYVHHTKRDIDNEWVIFHDEDNYWEPDHLQSMIDAAEANPESMMVGSDALWVGAHDKNWKEIRECKLRQGGCDLGQFMYKTKLFRDYGYFFAHPHSKHAYDWELINKMTSDPKTNLVYTHKPSFVMNYKKR
jgi:glycosyltransferase involved in cell wall biosynthesis